MARAVDGAAHFADAAHDARRRFVVHDAHGFDRVLAVLVEPRLDGRRIGAAAPIGRNDFGLQTELRRHLLPQRREPARLGHEHAIARRQRVDERGFPRTRARRRVDDDVRLGLEDRLDLGEHLTAELAELRARDGRSSAGPWRAARDRERWWGRGSGESGGRSGSSSLNPSLYVKERANFGLTCYPTGLD